MTLQKTDTSIRKRKKVHLFIYIARDNCGKKRNEKRRNGKEKREENKRRKGLKRKKKTKERRLRIEKRNKENTNKQKTAKTFCNFSDLHYLCKNLGKRLSWNRSKNKHKITKKINNNGNHQPKREKFHHQPLLG